ncbi:MAG TPA: acyl-CoA dehydratase activase-related protein, partial [Bacillota bacterium]|nr:acyl-CoA dehydratase activase-related protein [Bacillota bacterium]
MTARVGIPRALFYYTYFPMWQAFLEKLGVEV